MTQAIWDLLIFSLMIRSTLRLRRFREGRTSFTGSDLVGLVWRDGAIYFGIMAIATLVNIGFFYVRDDGIRGTLAPVASRCVCTRSWNAAHLIACITQHICVHDVAPIPEPSRSGIFEWNRGRRA